MREDIALDPSDEWISIDAIGFHGRWLRSPNGRWLLAYGQVHDPRADTWSSDDPSGEVLLFESGRQVCRLDGLCRPETVALCDAGIFAVYELGPADEFLGPGCQLSVFTDAGRCIFEHRPGAAVERPALSAEGRYLAFYTLAAPQGLGRAEDGESLFLVDLSSASVLWQQPVPVVWPSRVTFDERSQQVVVHGERNDIFRYTYEGNFLDEEVVERIKLWRAVADEYGYQLFDLALSRLGENPFGQSNERVGEAEELIGKALTRKMSANTKARAHRVLGEIAEARGDVSAAVTEYSAALELNPKIGLKKKMQALTGRRDKT